jgi:ElaA protein
LYLKKFYESFGFLQCSETYLEDDIPHIKMIRNQ